MVKHTPGPWGIEFCEHQGASTSKLYVCNPSGRLAEVYILNWYRDIDRAVANARLMAVSPDMRDALNYVADMTYCNADGEWQYKSGYDPQIVLSIIAKATGELA